MQSNEVIYLSKLRESDVPSLHKILKKAMVVKYLPITTHKNLKDTEDFYNGLAGNDTNIMWKISIMVNEKLTMAGIIDLTGLNNKSANLAYIIDPNYSGSGIATNAINSIAIYAFNKLKLESISAPVMESNVGSKRVLEKNNFIKTTEREDGFNVYSLYKSHPNGVIN